MNRRLCVTAIALLCSAVVCSKRKPPSPPDDGLGALSGRAWRVVVKATGPDGEIASPVKGDLLLIEGDRHLYLDKSGKVVDQGRFKPLGAKRMVFRTPQGRFEMEATALTAERAVLKGVAILSSLVTVQLQVEMQLTRSPVPVPAPVPATLHEAARLGDVNAIDRLLAGANVNEVKDGWSPLMLASYYCHPAAVRRLLDAGAQPDLAPNTGKPPILLAAESGDADVIAALLAKHANPRVRSVEDNESPLIVALHNGDRDAVRALVEGGAPLADEDETGSSPLCLAALGDPLGGREYADVVRYLLDRKVDANQACPGGCTPLFMAVQGDFADTFRALLEHGADPNRKDADGRTLAEHAEKAPKILKILQERQRH